MVRIFFLLCLLPSAIIGTAQETSQNFGDKKSLRAVRTNGIINIDGILNENGWQVANTIDGFTQIEPRQGQPSNYRTVVKILYDNRNLYIGTVCYDTLGKKGVRVTEIKRDFATSQNDVFGVCIDAFKDKRNNMTFLTNPFGPKMTIFLLMAGNYWIIAGMGFGKLEQLLQIQDGLQNLKFPGKLFGIKSQILHNRGE